MAQVNAQAGHMRARHPASWQHHARPMAPVAASASSVHPAHRGGWRARPGGVHGLGQYDTAVFDPNNILSPPPPALPATVPAPGSIPASQALALLQARYAVLVRLGVGLVKLGTAVPCNVIKTYSRAVDSYLRDGVDLFKQIQQAGGVVEQVVFDERGEPHKDGQGNFVTQVVTTPPLPPFPATDPKTCSGFLPYARQLAGALGRSGLGQVVPPSLILGALRAAWPFIVRIGLLVVSSYAIGSVLDKIMVIWRGYNVAPEKAVDAYLQCVAKLQAGGVAAAAAAQQCAGVVPGVGMSPLAWVGVFSVVAAAAGGIAYYFFKTTSPAERERRERVATVEREAEEAQEAAARAATRARRYKAGHFSPEAA